MWAPERHAGMVYRIRNCVLSNWWYRTRLPVRSVLPLDVDPEVILDNLLELVERSLDVTRTVLGTVVDEPDFDHLLHMPTVMIMSLVLMSIVRVSQ